MSSTMAKNPKPPKTPDPEQTPEDPVNRTMGFRATPELRAVIEALARKERRRPASLLQILVEDALTARGLWPPPEGDSDKPKP